MTFVLSDELMAELLSAFSTEAAEELAALNERLLALEHGDVGADREGFLRAMFRSAHTLKGGAAAVNLPEVKELAHRLESLFGALQSGDFEPGAEDFDILYRVLDAIGNLVAVATTNEAAPQVDVAAMARELDALIAAQGAAGGPPLAAVPDDHREPEEPETDGPEDVSASSSSVPATPSGPIAPSGSPVDPIGDGPVPGEPSPAAEEVVRISTTKLDMLLSEVGELIVARNAATREISDLHALAGEFREIERAWRANRSFRRRIAAAGRTSSEVERMTEDLVRFMDVAEEDLDRTLPRLDSLLTSLETTSRRANQITAALHDDMRAVRMLPLQSILGTFPRMVRDLARQQGKEVTLEVTGADTEVDRAVLQQIKAPLMHLLRNCVDHGLEEPPARIAAGKPIEGKISITAYQQGDAVGIEVADDGRGIDAERVKAAAVAKGVVSEEDTEALDPTAVLWLAFRSGVSTSPIVTEVSGRGVGLDVVRENVEAIGGTIEVATKPGEGTRFSLALPLTVTITPCLIVRVASHLLALPIGNIVRALRVTEQDIHDIEGRAAIKVRDDAVALTELADEMAIVPEGDPPSPRPVIVVRGGDGVAAVAVDQLVQVQDLIVKGLPRRLAGVAKVSGTAILASGEPVLILNLADIARSDGVTPSRRVAPSPTRAITQEPAERKRILLADDSLTTRTLEKNILQAAGYEVNAVGDGSDAWDVLQLEGADLLVSDVQMPHIDGFELTEKIRKDARFHDLPVVLVTSLDSPDDRRRGIEVGADAYIVKSGFDQEHLIDVIRRLI